MEAILYLIKHHYLPPPEGKQSDLHVGVCESFFPLIHEDRLLRSRVPNKYLETQTTVTLVTRCSLNALIQSALSLRVLQNIQFPS